MNGMERYCKVCNGITNWGAFEETENLWCIECLNDCGNVDVIRKGTTPNGWAVADTTVGEEKES